MKILLFIIKALQMLMDIMLKILLIGIRMAVQLLY